MQHYVAFVWDEGDRAAADVVSRYGMSFSLEASAWSCAVNRAGLLIFHRASKSRVENAHLLPECAGVVLGQLFPEFSANGWTLQRLLRSRGQSLVDDHWGRYVAFLYDSSQRVHYVVRDPSGQMPCYWLPVGRVNVFFADLGDVLPLVEDGLTIDESSIKAFLLSEDVRLRQTGFREIREVFAGEEVRLDGGRSSLVALWDPGSVCESGVLDDAAAAGAVLRETTQSCIGAWAGQYDDVLLNLSGGFDSAVVLGCLARASSRPRVTAVNRYLARPDEDERAFARAAARRASVQLVEREWDAAGVSLERVAERAPVIPRPSVQSLGVLDLQGHAELAAMTGATATWTGQGGDHLFYQMKSEGFVADHVRRCGCTAAVFQVMDRAARLTRKSYWSILRSVVARAKRISDQRETFLTAEIVEAMRGDLGEHPWVRNSGELPPGKRLQVAALVDLVHRPSPCEALRAAPEFHPLISQPLMEACLRIPSDVLLYEGRLRGLAHEAFRDYVPAEILHRASKGATRSYLMRIVRENVRLIRELLLEGLLAQLRWLNRERIVMHLVKDQPLRPGQLFPLLACVTAEIWLRNARQRAY